VRIGLLSLERRMIVRALVLSSLWLGCDGAAAAAPDARPPLKDVSAVRIANYGTPSTVIHDRAQVNAIVAELRRLRSKTWRRADDKVSCYATLVLLSGSKSVALFRVTLDVIVERTLDKVPTSYSINVDPADLPKVNALLVDIPPPKNCQ
jgi:hypothetical protein